MSHNNEFHDRKNSCRKEWWKNFNILGFIMNDRVSLKIQLLTTFTSITLISGGVTLGICLGMLFSLGNTASSNASSIIMISTRSNIRNIGMELAADVNAQLKSLSDSFCLMGAYASQIFLKYAEDPRTNYSTILEPFPSYREYYFENKSCGPPFCPSDFGPIAGRSRIPFIQGAENGSMEHSSVYLYSSKIGRSLRTDVEWNETFNTYPVIKRVIDGVAYQDLDLNNVYKNGPNSTIMLFLAYQVTTNKTSGDYISITRTFPGIPKNSTDYDPVKREWFYDAPIDGISFYGPFKEAFTGLHAITLSSKKQKIMQSGEQVEIVASAVLQIEEVASYMNKVQYIDNGFGALVSLKTNLVISWGTQITFNETLQTFKAIDQFDAVLARYDLTYNQVIEYTDVTGKGWIVSVEAFFPDVNGNNELALLVFAEAYISLEPLRSLQSNIDGTTGLIVVETIIIVCCTVGAVLVLVAALVVYITRPLEVMRNISNDIVRISAKDEASRDYTDVKKRAFVNGSRTDELGMLALDYYKIICLMQEKADEKHNVIKYPPNPYFLKGQHNYAHFTWKTVHQLLRTAVAYSREVSMATSSFALAASASPSIKAPQGSTRVAEAGNGTVSGAPAADAEPSKPPLESAGAEGNTPAATAAAAEERPTESVHKSAVVAPAGVDLHHASPLHPHDDDHHHHLHHFKHDTVSPSPESVPPGKSIYGNTVEESKNSSFMDVITCTMVDVLTSLKSKLYLISFLLLAGLVLTMLLTIVPLSQQGTKWTSKSGPELESTQVLNLQTIASVKAMFVEVSLQPIYSAE